MISFQNAQMFVLFDIHKIFLLQCPIFLTQRDCLLNELSDVLPNVAQISNKDLTHLLLFGKEDLSKSTNTQIFEATQTYILNTKRFLPEQRTP